MISIKVKGDYIDGKFRRPRGAERRVVSSDPGDAGWRIGAFPLYPQHVERAAQAARRSFAAWRRVPLERRADFLRKFAAEVFNRRRELARLVAAETGKPLWEAEQEVNDVKAQVETEIREGIRAVSPFKVGEVRFGVKGLTRYRPLGPVLVLRSIEEGSQLKLSRPRPVTVLGSLSGQVFGAYRVKAGNLLSGRLEGVRHVEIVHDMGSKGSSNVDSWIVFEATTDPGFFNQVQHGLARLRELDAAHRPQREAVARSVLLRGLKDVSAEERPNVGAALNKLKQDLTAALEQRESAMAGTVDLATDLDPCTGKSLA